MTERASIAVGRWKSRADSPYADLACRRRCCFSASFAQRELKRLLASSLLWLHP